MAVIETVEGEKFNLKDIEEIWLADELKERYF